MLTEFETRLLGIMMMVIMLGMGASLTFKDFRIAFRKPQGILVGLLCQYGIMPFLGYALAVVLGLPPALAIGLILPFVLVLSQSLRENPLASLVAGAATMLGAFFAVANLSIGSQLIPLTHLQWEQMAPEPFKTAFGLVIMAILLGLFLVSYKVLPYEQPAAQKSEA